MLKVKGFKNNVFFKNVLTLMTGTIIAQAIPIAISPILTRLYTPEEFGVYALYTSVVAVLSIVATGRYELAIMLPISDKEAANIVALSTVITMFFSSFTLIIVSVFNKPITKLLGNPDISNWLYLMPVSILIVGLYQSLNYWSNRKKEYKRIMLNRVIHSTSTGGLNVGLGLFGSGSSGLILSPVAGQLIATIRFIFKIKKNQEITKDFLSRNEIIRQAKTYKNFPKYSIVAHGTETMSSNLPVILMTSFFGSMVVGFYSLARRTIIVPISVFAGAIGDVFLQKASQDFKKNSSCSEIFIKTFITLFSLGIIPFSILFIYAPNIFSFVFGDQWREAGLYTRYLTIPFFLQFIASPLSNMFVIAERQKKELFLQITVLLFSILSLCVGYYLYDSERIAIVLFSIVLSIKYIVFLVMSFYFSYNKKGI